MRRVILEATQLATADLPGRRQRELFNELDLAWDFVGGHLARYFVGGQALSD